MTMLIPDPLKVSEAQAVLDIAEMVRRDGHRQYGVANGNGNGAWMSSLCGVTAVFGRDGQVMSLQTHDLQVEIMLSTVAVDAADGIERYKTNRIDVATRYRKGDTQMLGAWHRNLCAYRRSMQHTSHAIAA